MEEWSSTENRPFERLLGRLYSLTGRKHIVAQGKVVEMPSRKAAARQLRLFLSDDKVEEQLFPPLPYDALD